MAAANPVLNHAAGPDSPGWDAFIMTTGVTYDPPRFLILATAGEYTLVLGSGNSITFTFPAGHLWLRVQSVTSGAGAVLGVK